MNGKLVFLLSIALYNGGGGGGSHAGLTGENRSVGMAQLE
jgi:hypothetical protein